LNDRSDSRRPHISALLPSSAVGIEKANPGRVITHFSKKSIL